MYIDWIKQIRQTLARYMEQGQIVDHFILNIVKTIYVR